MVPRGRDFHSETFSSDEDDSLPVSAVFGTVAGF